ncbi:MAG: GNAT family N-acetyltransferase [Acidimicrobiales bacterium]
MLRAFEERDLGDLFDIHSRVTTSPATSTGSRGLAPRQQNDWDTRCPRRSHTMGGRLSVAVVEVGEPALDPGAEAAPVTGLDQRRHVGMGEHRAPPRRGRLQLPPSKPRRGLATKTAAAILDIGLERFGLHRVIDHCDARKAASARLLERLGMREEAHFVQSEILKGEFGDEIVYATLKDSGELRAQSSELCDQELREADGARPVTDWGTATGGSARLFATASWPRAGGSHGREPNTGPFLRADIGADLLVKQQRHRSKGDERHGRSRMSRTQTHSVTGLSSPVLAVVDGALTPPESHERANEPALLGGVVTLDLLAGCKKCPGYLAAVSSKQSSLNPAQI